MAATPTVRRTPDRRNHTSRDEVLNRIRTEFREMPSLRLTCPQVQRLFHLRADVCQRVIEALVREGVLAREQDDRLVVPSTVSAAGRWRMAG